MTNAQFEHNLKEIDEERHIIICCLDHSKPIGGGTEAGADQTPLNFFGFAHPSN